MDAEISAARQARAQYRHDLRRLTYVTLDQANGGIVRNLTHDGIGVQAVVALRPRQQMRVRFELRYPRVRVETRGEVVWSTFSGQCGIRFLDMQPRVTRQIKEWIFGNLLEGATLHPERVGPMFAETAIEDDGLLLSAAPRKIIELPLRPESPEASQSEEGAPQATDRTTEMDWLSQPLSGRTLAWTVDTLAVFAAVLLFALVFLSVTRETPRWPWAMAAGVVTMMVVLYWGFFRTFGGSSFGARLARMAADDEEEDVDARFR
jgi:hypothetical protein